MHPHLIEVIQKLWVHTTFSWSETAYRPDITPLRTTTLSWLVWPESNSHVLTDEYLVHWQTLNAQKGEDSHCPLRRSTVNSWGPLFQSVWASIRALPTTARHKGTSVAHSTEVATVFFVSLGESHKLFFFLYASFFSITPSSFFEAYFPLLCCSSQWPLQTDTPPSQRFVCQYGQLRSGTKAQWLCPHTAPHPHRNQSITDSHILLYISQHPLFTLLLFYSRCISNLGQFRCRLI